MRLPSIRARLLSLLLALSAIAIVVAAISFGQAEAALASAQAVGARGDALQLSASQLSDALHEQEANFIEFELTGDQGFLNQYRSSIEIERGVDSVDRFADESRPDVAQAFAAVRSSAERWRSAAVDPEIARILRGAPRPADAITKAEVAFDLTRQALEQLSDALAHEDLVGQQRLAELGEFRTVLLVGGILLLLVSATAASILVARWVSRPLGKLVASARSIQAGEEATFEYGRDDEIGQLGRALEEMRLSLGRERALTAQEGDLATVINAFTELTAFTEEETEISTATLAALDEIAHPSDAALHVSNRSQDRALPQASLGDPSAEVISLHRLTGCPGVRRGSPYVSGDLAARLSVHCPVYPASSGTLACVPLVALGDTVGVAHLHWSAPNALPLNLRAPITRVAEHAALSIANRRLVTVLQGQASTDSRTGLPNSRTFDSALERELETRSSGDRLAVLMLDLDFFKSFNDRHGHPAGDQALRAFADVLRSCVRDDDVAARYGGEEFAVLLRGHDSAAALSIAERIRERTESAIIALAPGLTDRLTVSIGVAVTPDDGIDRMTLLAAADAALYRAKQRGRNQVALSRDDQTSKAPAARPGLLKRTPPPATKTG